LEESGQLGGQSSRCGSKYGGFGDLETSLLDRRPVSMVLADNQLVDAAAAGAVVDHKGFVEMPAGGWVERTDLLGVAEDKDCKAPEFGWADHWERVVD